MEIKHIHPEPVPERSERLREIHRTCAALVAAQRKKAAPRSGRDM